MLGKWETHWEIDWFRSSGLIAGTEAFKTRRHVQWRLRKRFGKGNWRVRGQHIEVRQPYSREWAEVGCLYEERNFQVFP